MTEALRFIPDPDGDAWLVDAGEQLGDVVRGRFGALTATSALRRHAIDRRGMEVPVVIPDGPLPFSTLTQLFVYGSLRRGGRYHGLLAEHQPTLLGPATTEGQLLDLGPYPGLVLEEPAASVRGELYSLATPGPVLRALDGLEDFLGYGVEGSMYRRIIVNTSSGRAWTYLLLQVDGRRGVIDGGEWTV